MDTAQQIYLPNTTRIIHTLAHGTSTHPTFIWVACVQGLLLLSHRHLEALAFASVMVLMAFLLCMPVMPKIIYALNRDSKAHFCWQCTMLSTPSLEHSSNKSANFFHSLPSCDSVTGPLCPLPSISSQFALYCHPGRLLCHQLSCTGHHTVCSSVRLFMGSLSLLLFPYRVTLRGNDWSSFQSHSHLIRTVNKSIAVSFLFIYI